MTPIEEARQYVIDNLTKIDWKAVEEQICGSRSEPPESSSRRKRSGKRR